MLRRRISHSVLFLIGVILLTGGCTGRLAHREVLDSTSRIALVSTVMPRIADTASEANRKVLQAAVDHAAARVLAGLAGLRPWTVLDAAVIDRGKEAMSFGDVSRMDLSDLFREANEQNRVRDAVGAEMTSWRERFIGATGLPIIPREALASGMGLARKDPAIRTVLLDQAGKLCNKLEVDAVAIAQVQCTVTHPREKAFIVTEERTDGLLALSATLLVVDKTGTIIVDMGLRPIDGRSPSRDLLPLYRGAGEEAVAPVNIDLADPKKKIAQAFTVLVDDAVADLMASLKSELSQ